MSTTSPSLIKSPSKTYSPIKVPDSPLSSQQGQLTGVPRRIRDTAADLYNAIQEWNRLHVDGMQIIHQIKNFKLDELEKKQAKVNIYPEGLQELCNQLEDICLKLKSVVLKLDAVVIKFGALKELQEMKCITRPIFLTWSIEKYVCVSKSICDGYNKELLLKSHIHENIAHVSLKEDIMLHSALWAHQPYIDNNFNFLLESMLKETEHREAQEKIWELGNLLHPSIVKYKTAELVSSSKNHLL